MDLIKSLTLSLGKEKSAVISDYTLGRILYSLYKNKSYEGIPITKLKKDLAEKAQFNRYQKILQDHGILSPLKGFPSTVHTLLGQPQTDEAEIICSIDPFCYISHLSAMSFHGLTNRIPTTIYISSPSAKAWKELAEKKMEKDLGDDFQEYNDNDMPKLSRTKMTKIGKKEIRCFNSMHWGAYINITGKNTRVSTIGRTFLDMLKNPELCGGIHHVMEVFEDHAETGNNVRLITDELERHGGLIDKVRAGYILDERLGIKNDVVESWLKHAQRGGSRKLDASNEYISEWSDKWCLSLNIN